MRAKIKNVLRMIKRYIKAVLRRGRNYVRGFIYQIYPPLPRTVNFMVNDICNSRCKMCNIWTKKLEKEITPSELTKVLNDPLFDKLQYVGVSGGEPTLRKDLPQLFEAIVNKKGLKATGIITNAIQEKVVIKQVIECSEICRKANVPFNVMISLDGVGDVHDLVRNRVGNFKSAINVIEYLKTNTKIPLSIGCTVVKENVWYVDELLDYCRKNNIYGRFRIAEFIKRLYNDDLDASIRNFTEDERYHIALFFSKLELEYEKDPNVKETYKNIRQMIYEGKPRQVGCPYKQDAVALDSRGNLIYCAPKSPVIGSCLTDSAVKLYQKNIKIRNKIIKNDCGQCVHDYHVPPSAESLRIVEEERMYTSLFSVNQVLKESQSLVAADSVKVDFKQLRKPLIIGWYGTETAGDKAILGDICKRIFTSNPKAKITIASLYPFITKRTLFELGFDAKIVKVFSKDYLKSCKNADAVIMGGGPLMGMEPLGFVLKAFATAQKFKVPTIIEGCGIGPLREEKYISTVKEIIRLSTQIKVRDKKSLDWVFENTDRKDAACSGDPAGEFVKDWQNNHKSTIVANNDGYFCCFFRELTEEYSNGLSKKEFEKFKLAFEDSLAELVFSVSKKTGLKPLFLPMHTFVVGKDDREFARGFTSKYLKDIDYKIEQKVYSAQDILEAMSKSKFNICMRFHSVLFAEMLGVPYIAIDYTGGGKIKGFLTDKQKVSQMIDRQKLVSNEYSKVIEKLFKV